MKRSTYILFFLFAISLSLLVVGSVYNLISGKSIENNLVELFFLNLPLCVGIGLLDIFIIGFTTRKLRMINEILRVVIDLSLTTTVCIIVTASLNYTFGSEFNPLKDSLSAIPWNLIVVLLIEVFYAHLREEEISKEKARYQFQLLKTQMNPHFLFNSLNVIASLAYQDAEKTNLFAKKLSTVYRYLLNTYERPTVTVAEEIAFLKSYLYLENIRFENTLAVEIDVATGCEQQQIIPASVQMLVENAIKHNRNTQSSPLHIFVHVSAIGVRVSNNLQLRTDIEGTGTGLANLRKQYAMYGKTIEISESETEYSVLVPFLKDTNHRGSE